MPKKTRIPRVSILVPFQGDDAAFEETLVSVLEHQPAGCEVVVAHNGTYTDPFELGDEVKFAVARSSNLVDLIRDGFEATRSQFVHILAPGLVADSDWISEALEPFERSHIASVVPAVINVDGRRQIAGWKDTPGLLGKTVRDDNDSIGGGFLDAVLYRRRILGGLLGSVAAAIVDEMEVGYAFGCLLQFAGWETAIAPQSILHRTRRPEFGTASSEERGKRLAAIRDTILPDAEPLRVTSLIREGLFGASSVAEMLGTLRYRSELAGVARMIDLEALPGFDTDSGVLRATTISDRAAA
ncbi:MAG: hypothetical protein AAFX06_13770 [Planctomycetota bacterium]